MGVHLPRNWDLGSRGPISTAFLPELIYLRDLGLPGWFLAKWVRSGQKFWYPTEFQLLSSGMVTAVRGATPGPDDTPTPGNPVL
jgi:hypothetical protein